MTTRSRSFRLLAAASLFAVALAACGSGTSEPTNAPGGASAAPASQAPASLPLEVDVATAATMRDAGAFVLDVRQPDEWVAGHIPGATLIPLGELPTRTAEVPSDREVVVVCRSGNRSATGRDILLDAGFASVTSMAGGMTDWAAAGLEVATGQ
jgi:rhodanese-related sulfurtransferase